jgi:hypothetical protein
MSGYLARLVAAAQRPGGSVHPMGASAYRERGPSDRRDDVQPGVLDDTRPAEDLSHHAGAVARTWRMEAPPFAQLPEAKDGELLSGPQVATSEERSIVMGRDAILPEEHSPEEEERRQRVRGDSLQHPLRDWLQHPLQDSLQDRLQPPLEDSLQDSLQHPIQGPFQAPLSTTASLAAPFQDSSTPPRPKSHAELPLGDVRERRALTRRDHQATRPTDPSQAGTVNWGNEARAGHNPDFDLGVERWDRKMKARAEAAGSGETMIPGMRRAIAGATSETPRQEERPVGSGEAAPSSAHSADVWPGEPLAPLLQAVPGPQPRAANAARPISRWHGDNSKRDPSRQREAPQRHQDEIQIHIGRIEVTAAQPAPVRTPPIPMRTKTPSLDEYLRRGKGRA